MESINVIDFVVILVSLAIAAFFLGRTWEIRSFAIREKKRHPEGVVDVRDAKRTVEDALKRQYEFMASRMSMADDLLAYPGHVRLRREAVERIGKDLGLLDATDDDKPN